MVIPRRRATAQTFVRDANNGSPTGNNAVTSVGGSVIDGILPTFTSADVGSNQLIFKDRLIPGTNANSEAFNVGQLDGPEAGPNGYWYQLKYLAGVNWRAYNNHTFAQDEWVVGATAYDAIVRLTRTFGATDKIVPSISFDNGVSFTDSLTVDTFTEAGMDAGGAWYVQLQNATGGAYFDDIEMFITPKPATRALLALGGLTVLIRRRR